MYYVCQSHMRAWTAKGRAQGHFNTQHRGEEADIQEFDDLPAGVQLMEAPRNRARPARNVDPETGEILDRPPAVPNTGGIPWDNLSEKGKLLAEALDAAVDPAFRSQTRRQMLQAFEDQSTELLQNPAELETFLDDYGLTLHQIRQIKRRLLPRREYQQSMAGGGQQTMVFDPRTGQMVPVIVISPGGGVAPPAPGNPVIVSPDFGQRGNQEPPLTRKDVLEILEEWEERRSRKGRSEEPPPFNPNVRRFQEPIIDQRGNQVMRWVEEPINPLQEAVGFLAQLGLVGQKDGQPNGVTIEDVREAVKNAAPRQEGLSPDVVALRETVVQLQAKLEAREQQEQAVQAATDRVLASLEPDIRRLREYEARQGITDYQADLAHQEKLTGRVMQTLDYFREGLREDLQPMFKAFAAAQLRSQGLGEQAITDILTPRSSGLAAAGGEAHARRAQTVVQRWVKP